VEDDDDDDDDDDDEDNTNEMSRLKKDSDFEEEDPERGLRKRSPDATSTPKRLYPTAPAIEESDDSTASAHSTSV
jgi:hypothetical protein